MKQIRYAVEAGLLYVLFFIFRILPLDTASACGGWIGRTLGPRMAASRKALANLRIALPGKTDEEYDTILKGMWDNLGRVMSEYPHLEKIGRERMEMVGGAALRSLAEAGKPCLLIAGHLANWEVAGPALATHYGLKLNLVYRAPNNPRTAELLNHARSLEGKVVMIPKSRSSVRAMVQALQKGQHIGMLIDQKYNEGISVPFLGRPAMASSAYVQLSQKFKCPLIPCRIERIGGARFRMTSYESLKTFDENGKPLPIETVMANAHSYLENWIQERPEQWLWLHRRWG